MKVEANETFRIKGKPIVKLFESRLPFNRIQLKEKTYLFSLQAEILNKDEVIELIDWLINKVDEIR